MIFRDSKIELVHNAKWGEDMENIIEREKKMDADVEISLYDDFVVVNDVLLYDEECFINFKFDESKELYKIICNFHSSKGTTFEKLANELESIYGEELSLDDFGSIRQTKIWFYKDTMIELEYDPNDEDSNYDWSDISITYTNQGK